MGLGLSNFLTWNNPNLPLSSHSRKLLPLVTALFDNIIPHGFVQLVTQATRFMSGREPSGLDHIYTNRPEKMSEVQVVFRGSSDHRLVLSTRYTKSVIGKRRILRKRCFKHFKADKFLEDLAKVSWWDVYMTTEVNNALKIFNEKLLSILDLHAPVRTIQVRNNFAPWLSSSTKELMKERDRMQHRASLSNIEEDWQQYTAQK